MAYPRIVWNSNNLSFPQPLSKFEYTNKANANLNVSVGGYAGSVFHFALSELKIEMKDYTDRGFHRDLIAWWAYARQGNTFSFAFDSDLMVSTTLDGVATAGTTTVPLTATTGITVGDYCRIQSTDRTKEEIIKVASISAGVSITTDSNLLYTYASGDLFKSEEYWDNVILKSKKFPAKENRLNTFDFKLELVEVVG